jgi:hypothetical protein
MNEAKLHGNADRRSSSAPLSANLDKKLFAYAAAAGAAGVTLLAQSAEAKVVYTAANIPLSSIRFFTLDLNNDGIRDFIFSVFQHEGYGLTVQPPKLQPQNAILGTWKDFAPALSSGVTVGPGASFRAERVFMEDQSCRSGCTTFGPWAHAQSKYLGLSFIVNGEVHYGWARLNVNGGDIRTSVVTGYAYETDANTAIVTGQTDGADKATPQASAPEILNAPAQPASLGVLARGASTLSVWRRDEE